MLEKILFSVCLSVLQIDMPTTLLFVLALCTITVLSQVHLNLFTGPTQKAKVYLLLSESKQELCKHFLQAQSDREKEPFFQEVSLFSGTQGFLCMRRCQILPESVG